MTAVGQGAVEAASEHLQVPRVSRPWGFRPESLLMNGIIYLVGLVVVVLAVLGFLGIR